MALGLLAVMVAVLAGAILLLLARASALDRRPPLRMTKEYDLLERAAEARRRAAEERTPRLPGPGDGPPG